MGYFFLRKIHASLLISCLGIIGISYGQSIEGVVLEESTNEPIVGASITILDSDPIKGAVSDLLGEFTIKDLDYDNYSLSVSFIGFETLIIPDVLLTSGKQTRLELVLSRGNNELGEVQVVSKNYNNLPVNSLAIASVKAITFEQSERIPGSFNDPSRLALAFAGVTTQDDASNTIILRGNSPNGILWRLEGLEIPNPSHFFSATVGGGAVSMINTYMLSKSDFYTGAFPAEIGNAFSGAFDLNLKSGNSNNFEANIRLGVLGLDAMLEGPFSKKKGHSYILNYRYSTISLVQKIGFPTGGRTDNIDGLSSNFQDLNFNFNFKLPHNSSLNLYGLGGIGTSSDIAKTNNSNYYNQEGDYTIGVGGLSYNRPLKQNHFLKFNAAINYSNNVYQEYYGTNGTERIQFSVMESTWTYRLGLRMNTIIGKNAELRYGANLNYHFIDLDRKNYSYYNDRVSINKRYTGSDQALFAQLFVNYKQKINQKWVLQSGVYGSYFQLGNAFNIEPRISAKVNFLPKQHLYVSTGLHSQLMPLSFYVATNDNLENPQFNKDYGLINALHLVGGYTYDFSRNVSLKTELYYQYLYDLPVHDPNVEGADPYYISVNDLESFSRKPTIPSGIGRNYGLELTVEKHYSKNYFILFNTSVYSSKYKLNKEDIWKNTRYNGNVIVNLSGGKDFKVGKEKQNRLGISTKILTFGGARFPVLDEDQLAQNGIYTATEDLIGRTKQYLRWDLRLAYLRNKRRYSWELSLDVQNVTNHKNERKRTFDYGTLDYDIKYQFGILPILKYSLMLTNKRN